MSEIKRIGIAAHNTKKEELVECLRQYRDNLIFSFFFVDPLEAHVHEADSTALICVAQVYGIVYATTAASVDFI